MKKIKNRKLNLKWITILSLIFIIIIIKKNIIFVTITTKSMEPTIEFGQKAIVITKKTNIKQNDIIVFKNSNLNLNADISFLAKRVAAKENDHILIENNKMFVNNVFYKYIGNINSKDLDIKLKYNEYFVMGDNVNNSYDSRNFGPICHENIIGKIIYIFNK